MAGARKGGGQIYIFSIIKDRTFKHKYQYLRIIQRNSMKIFCQGRPRGRGAIFIFSLFLEIGPTNINFNIFIYIRDMFFLIYISLKTSIETNSSLNLSKFLSEI